MANKRAKKPLSRGTLKKTRGGVAHTPQVADEIVVSFQPGDVRKPYVTGALWTSDTPPDKK